MPACRLEVCLRLEFKLLNTSLWLGVCCIALSIPACSYPPTAIHPAGSPVPSTSVAVETSTATLTNATPAPTSAVCPPPGDPAFPQPAEFLDYPDAIQLYLSAGGDLEALRSKLIAWNALSRDEDQVVSADLDGNGFDEVILSVVDPQGHTIAPSGVVLVFECSARGYVRRYREGGGEIETFNPSTEILKVDDLTLDGLHDVVYVLRSCGAHTCYERLKVLGWDGAQLTSLMADTLELPYPDYALRPGRIEAVSGGIGSVGAEPQRGYAEIWAWNGRVFTRTKTVYEPPVYRYHALLDGDRALRSGGYVTATQAYERVIEDDTLKAFTGAIGQTDEAEERAFLTAFARWRLLLIGLETGELDRAQAELSRLQVDNPPGSVGSRVTELSRVFWETHSQGADMTESCSAIVSSAERYASVLAFFNDNYGYANPLWEPTDLCPF